MLRHRVQIRFTKQGDLRMIGHRDLLRAWERLIRRAALPLSMTEGFHPKPRVNFPSALAVGIAGTDEVVEIELTEPLSAKELSAWLPRHCPPGMDLGDIQVIPLEGGKAHVRRVSLEIGVPQDRRAALAASIAAFMATESYPVRREQRGNTIDLRPLVEAVELTETGLRMWLPVSQSGSARPREVLEALGVGDLEEQGAFLVRTRVELHEQTRTAPATQRDEPADDEGEFAHAEKDHS